jgi:GUN4-like.
MLKVAGREEEGWLRVEDIEKFPCSDLRTIDELSVKYSDGKFGFSVQKKIYQSLSGTKEYDQIAYRSFGDKVGWRQGGKWLSYSNLTFSLDTHFVKHSHFGSHLFGRTVGVVFFGGKVVVRLVGFWEGPRPVFCISSLAQRLVVFNL